MSTKKTPVGYLKLKFNLVSCKLTGSPTCKLARLKGEKRGARRQICKVHAESLKAPL